MSKNEPFQSVPFFGFESQKRGHFEMTHFGDQKVIYWFTPDLLPLFLCKIQQSKLGSTDLILKKSKVTCKTPY